MSTFKRRLRAAMAAGLTVYLAGCNLPAPAGMTPLTSHAAATENGSIAPPAAIAADVEVANAVATGNTGNAISGTIRLPLSIRALAGTELDVPRVRLHAFRVTGEVLRSARCKLYWRNDREVAFTVEGVPEAHMCVLAVSLDPGVVLRTFVPRASRAKPVRGVIIDPYSETVVMEAYLSGLVPAVGLGGAVEVLRQGGLAPDALAAAHRQAAGHLRTLAEGPWGRGFAGLASTGAALEKLAAAEAAAVAAVRRNEAPPATQQQALLVSAKEAEEALASLGAILEGPLEAGNLLPPDVAAWQGFMAALDRARDAELLQPSDFVAAEGRFHLNQVKPKVPLQQLLSDPFLRGMVESYSTIEFLTYFQATGVVYDEVEIEAAFNDGKGPYRTSCAQIAYAGDVNCRVTVNPMDRSREVLLTREADVLTTNLLAMEAAYRDRQADKIMDLVVKSPSLANFILDQDHWTTPVGTWRLRLVQDVGPDVIGGPGFPVLNDAETFLAAPRNTDTLGPLPSAPFVGVISIWMPSLGVVDTGGANRENLSNFSIRFRWDEKDRTLTEGQIRGKRRDGEDGDNLVDYAARFTATMVASNSISGFWINDERQLAGRFEMVRGTARFNLGAR